MKTIKYILIALYVFLFFYDVIIFVRFGILSFLGYFIFKFIWKILDGLFFWRIRDYKRRKHEEAELSRMLEENKNFGITLEKRFNNPITTGYNYAYCGYVFVSEPKNVVMINENIYDFTQILDCIIQDTPSQDIPEMTFKTTTDTGSIFGRAFVGGLIAGDVGRIIGGSTASRTTRHSGGTIITRHDYTLTVRIDSLTCPTVTLRIGQDGWLANQLHSTFKLIAERGSVLKRGI